MLRRARVAVVVAVAACSSEDTGAGPRLREGSVRDAGSTVADGATEEEGADGLGTSDPTLPDAGSDAQTDAGSMATGPTETGEATYYDAEGVGACGVPFPSDYLLAAINDEQYSKANCGRCASVTGPKGTVVVRILDKCPGCAAGDLDLSQTAFKKIADLSAGRVAISWFFVDCPF